MYIFLVGDFFQGYEVKMGFHKVGKYIKHEKHNAGIVANICSETQISSKIQ